MIDEKKLIEAITNGEYTTGNILLDMELEQFIKDFPKIVTAEINSPTVIPKYQWIPCSERLPEYSDDLVLAQVSGKPHMNITLLDALCLANYSEDEGWMLELYPEWKTPDIIAWMPLPGPYRPEGGDEV